MTALGNMATEGMILTNHDHQIRVGVLTGNPGRRSGTAAAAVPDLPGASRLWWPFSAAWGRGEAEEGDLGVHFTTAENCWRLGCFRVFP